MLRATDEQQLLESMCKAIVDAGGYPVAMVWYSLDDSERTLQPMAESGYVPGMEALQMLKVTADGGTFGRGAFATSIKTGSCLLAVVDGSLSIDCPQPNSAGGLVSQRTASGR